MSECRHGVEIPSDFSSRGGCYNCMLDTIDAKDAEIAGLKAIIQEQAGIIGKSCPVDRAEKAEAALRYILASKPKELNKNKPKLCGLCWTASFVPVDSENGCDLSHPHEGMHERCDYCWMTSQVEALRKELDHCYSRFLENL